MPKGHTVLIADPETDFTEWATKQLAAAEIRVISATRADEAFTLFTKEKPDLVIVDTHIQPFSGMELLTRIRERDSNAFVLLISQFGTTQAVIEAMKLGAFDFLRKESLTYDLRPVVENALRTREAAREARPADAGPPLDLSDVMIGHSPAMQAVFKMIGRVSRSDAAIMITGESGCGKEVVARAIQRFSLRTGREFVAINCAAIPETLLESELFGHEKGSFTGATAQRQGRFEQCDGGTLFLDEIGDMPMHVQTKLLRVLQEGEFSRVGGNETLKTDVRIIAATNRNLEREVERGKFREDLFYRLNVVRIHIPPLRERPEDIRPLALFFLQRLAKKKNNARLRFSDDALALMESYNWPGNVRELENTLQRAVVLAHAEIITSADLPLGEISAPRPADEAGPLTAESAAQFLLAAAAESGEPALAWIERLLARTALTANADDSAAARALGLKPAAFKKLLAPPTP